MVSQIGCTVNVVEEKESILATVTINNSNSSNNNNNNNNNQETMKSRNYRKQPYWALHTYFGKY